jgi:hypothetical protein
MRSYALTHSQQRDARIRRIGLYVELRESFKALSVSVGAREPAIEPVEAPVFLKDNDNVLDVFDVAQRTPSLNILGGCRRSIAKAAPIKRTSIINFLNRDCMNFVP